MIKTLEKEIVTNYKLKSGNIVTCSAVSSKDGLIDLSISYYGVIISGRNSDFKPLFTRIMDKFCSQNNIKIIKKIKHSYIGIFEGKGELI